MTGKPIVVLVHGAFADSTAWSPVIARVASANVDAVAVANPLRALAGDAEYLRDVVRSLNRPAVLVGHSYGGMVITEAAAALEQVRALVYVAAFTPAQGESALQLSSRFGGSTLGEALLSYPLADGRTELRIDPKKFHGQFAADLSPDEAFLLGRTQRPVTEAALTAGLVAGHPAWRTLPTWQTFGDADRNIPVELYRWQAKRSAARNVHEVAGASHAIALSRPDAVTKTILEAVEAGE